MVRDPGWNKREEEALGCRNGKKINLIGKEDEERREVKVKTEKKPKEKVSSKEIKINREEQDQKIIDIEVFRSRTWKTSSKIFGNWEEIQANRRVAEIWRRDLQEES